MALQAGIILLFGIEFPSKDYGLVQNYTVTDAVKRAEALAPDGSVVSIQEFGKDSKLNLTYIPLVTPTVIPPEIGTTFTIDAFDDTQWQIDTIETAYDVSGFQTVTVNAKYYPKIH